MSGDIDDIPEEDPERPKRGKPTGYGNPPVEHQFKKGTSGNPKGRPRGSKNKLKNGRGMLEKYILSEASRKIVSNVNAYGTDLGLG